MKYRTVSISATGGYEGDENCDYTDVEGVLTFAPEEMRHEIKVPIVNRKQYDKVKRLLSPGGREGLQAREERKPRNMSLFCPSFFFFSKT